MFGISGTEFTVIIVLALILIGPEKLPTYTKQFVSLIHGLRKQWDEARIQISGDVQKEMKENGLEETKNQLTDIRDEVLNPMNFSPPKDS